MFEVDNEKNCKAIVFWFIATAFYVVANIPYFFQIHDLSSFVIAASFTSIFIALIMLFPIKLVILFFLPLLATSAFMSYYKYFLGIIYDVEMIKAILNTNCDEAIELLNINLILWVLFLGVVPSFVIIVMFIKRNILWEQRFKLFLSILLLSIASVFVSLKIYGHSYKYAADSIGFYPPLNYLSSLMNYYNLYSAQAPKENLLDKHPLSLKAPLKDTKIVLILGESVRSDHLSLNGYKRQTTPLLSKRDNLISLPNFYSLATITFDSVAHIMKKDMMKNQTSLVGMVSSLGFNTYWVSAQGMLASSINNIAIEADYLFETHDMRKQKLGKIYDEDFVPIVVKKAIGAGSNFVVFHMISAHRIYDHRYPKAFKAFSPICSSEGEVFQSLTECTSPELLTNSYDNAIRYVDYVIDSVIKELENQNSVVIFISDHGESLGENGIYAHCMPMDKAPVEQKHVGAFIWMSDKYIKENGNKYRNLISNKYKRWDQSAIINSVLDLINAEGNLVDRKNSVFTK